jgi:hypothetical protein
VAATADPNCTEAIALTTSTPDGARESRPSRLEIAAVSLAATGLDANRADDHPRRHDAAS